MVQICLILLLASSCCFGQRLNSKEYPSFDGWFNNRGNPSAGTPDSTLTRRLPPHYQDGVYAPSGWDRPNPRTISWNLTSGTSGLPSDDGKTAIFYFFGQHIMQDIVDSTRAGCPPEFFNIEIPSGDSTFDPENTGTVQMYYQRSRYQTSNSGYSPNHPRDQLNEVTSYIDGTPIYGKDRSWANNLRAFATSCMDRPPSYIYAQQFGTSDCRGELTSMNNEGEFPVTNNQGLPLSNPVPPTANTPLSAKRFYQVGGRNINENPFVTSIDVIWFRHHNWLARKIGNFNRDWSDEKIFNEARIQNIAIYQKIILYDWLPLLLGICPNNTTGKCESVPSYTGYSPSGSVGITDIFEAAAKHYDVTMAPPGVFRRSKYDSVTDTCTFLNTTTGNDPFRVCNTYWSANEIFQQTSIDEVIMGMTSQIIEREDHIITADLRNFFHGPLEFSRRDLVALIIQQGRDHGLPDYNTARVELGLERRNSWNEINPTLFASHPSLFNDLDSIYGADINKLDVFIGGLLETREGKPGELFRSIILDQFVRLRNGDRFWFENTYNGLFTAAEVAAIHNVTFRDVILRTMPNINGSVDIQDNPFIWNDTTDTKLLCPQPYQIDGLRHSWSTTCTSLSTHDYFTGNEVSFALVFAAIGLFALLVILLMCWLGKQKEKQMMRLKKRAATKERVSLQESGVNASFVKEILGENKSQQVQLNFGPGKHITVKNEKGNRKLRSIDLNQSESIEIHSSANGSNMFVRSQKTTYDLVLSFLDRDAKNDFISNLNSFVTSQQLHVKPKEKISDDILMQEANTKEKRDEVLKEFFKEALAQAIKTSKNQLAGWSWSAESAKLINVTISKEEFAQYLKLKVDSMFVEQMFAIADKDDDGEVSFREFLNIVVLFTKGSPRDKAKLMFDMYDLDKSGELSRDEFKVMLKSMMEMVNASIDIEQVDHLADEMMASRGLESKHSLTLDDFQLLMSQYSGDLSEASLNLPGENPTTKPAKKGPQGHPQHIPAKPIKRRKTRLGRAQASLKRYRNSQDNGSETQLKRRHTKHVTSVQVVEKKYSSNKCERFAIAAIKLNQQYGKQIFFLIIYTGITVGVFLQAYYAVAFNAASGLGRIAGPFAALARASAAALMFNFSTLLLTMCRNIITLLRETFLHLYIPFDSAITMHKIIAWMAMLFTVLHIIFHGINFYSISTQSASDLLCLFRDYWFPTNYLPDFVFWVFQTITGVTGVILTLILIVMYTFASNFARRKIFNWFQVTHKLGYFLLYFFSVLHGSGMLISTPQFYYYFLGPGIIFTLDKLYSLSRRKVQISVVKAELLPSDVTHLEFKRPSNFDYKAGQWVRIACLAQSPSEYHPFTLSSAPHEETLKLHIRAVGPWTHNLRNIYNPEILRDSPYPKLYLDGPFGEGHQDWYKYEVSVLVGGGIGVTPFASILKDLVNATQTGANVTCKAVYFIWVTRDQKQYEWLTDIIAGVESKDKKMILSTHIFITQFPQKFDLRTTMLYICEQHFQKIAGKSLFTGLRAITHFGRPDFQDFFTSLANEHNTVKTFGVFSCGPAPMTSSVDKACSSLNKYEGPVYSHHFENF